MEEVIKSLVLKRPGHVIKYDWLEKEKKKEILSHDQAVNIMSRFLFGFQN